MKNINTDLPNYIKEASAKVAESIIVVMDTYNLDKQKKNSVYSKKYCKRLYNEALHLGSEELKLQPTTLRDKLERKNNRSSREVIRLIQSFLANDDLNALRDLLMPNNGTTYSVEDKRAIIESIKVILCMKYEVPIKCKK